MIKRFGFFCYRLQKYFVLFFGGVNTNVMFNIEFLTYFFMKRDIFVALFSKMVFET